MRKAIVAVAPLAVATAVAVGAWHVLSPAKPAAEIAAEETCINLALEMVSDPRRFEVLERDAADLNGDGFYDSVGLDVIAPTLSGTRTRRVTIDCILWADGAVPVVRVDDKQVPKERVEKAWARRRSWE